MTRTMNGAIDTKPLAAWRHNRAGARKQARREWRECVAMIIARDALRRVGVGLVGHARKDRLVIGPTKQDFAFWRRAGSHRRIRI